MTHRLVSSLTAIGQQSARGGPGAQPGERGPSIPRRDRSPWRQQQRRMVQYPDDAGWLRWVSKALERRARSQANPFARVVAIGNGSETSGGSWWVERPARRSPRSKASKGEPQTRDRDGISPAGLGGSNASRGCETLRAQPLCSDFGRGTTSSAAWEPRGDGAPPDWEDAIGDRNLGRREVLATFWEQSQGGVRARNDPAVKPCKGAKA
jgi:hypothetical protein